MLKRLCWTLAVASLAAGCGSKEVTVSTDEAQQRIEQLSPEEQDAIRRSQEAAAATAAQLPLQGMSEQQRQEAQQGLQLAIPMPPAAAPSQ